MHKLTGPLMAALCTSATLFLATARCAAEPPAPQHPNIVFIYGDDVGYGDIACYGATKVQTPNIDRLAKEGLKFTDAHCTSATCTPSRYGILTGQYPWRKKGTGVLPGDATLIIEPGRLTWPAMLKKAGYTTAAVGKWHLGLGTPLHPADWNGDVGPGPLEIGFDYCFIMPATGDRVPCVFIENHHVMGLDPKDPITVSYKGPLDDTPETEPTGRNHPELRKMLPSQGHNDSIINGIPRIGFMRGGHSALWVDENLADTLTHKATAFIEASKDGPFFLYFAAHDIHVPRAPNARFVGKSGLGVRGDVVDELDDSTGQILATLDRLKLTDNTIVIFSSDNGPVIDDGYKDGAAEHLGDHKAAGPYRGGKYSILEGGTRIPMIVRWPGHVKPGTSDALVNQIDFTASFAALVGQTLGPNDAPDSINTMPAILGDSPKGRDSIVEHAQPMHLALRQGPWKFIPAGEGPKHIDETNTATGFLPKGQLYNLADDPRELKNVAAENPDLVKQMSAELKQVRESGRTRPE
jgi:arylsulfatase A-like enzyme